MNISYFYRYSNRGFTLFEVVTVLALSAIVFSTVGYFYISFTKSQLEITKQLKSLEKITIAQDYIAKILVNALPVTMAMTNKQQCLHLMHIAGAGIFQKKLAQFDRYTIDLDHEDTFSQAEYLAINPHATKLTGYASTVLPVFSISPKAIVLKSTDNTILENKNFILLSKPFAFCSVNNEIRLYKNVVVNTPVDLSGQYSLVISELQGNQVFSLKKLSEKKAEVIINIMLDDTSSLKSYRAVIINHEL